MQSEGQDNVDISVLFRVTYLHMCGLRDSDNNIIPLSRDENFRPYMFSCFIVTKLNLMSVFVLNTVGLRGALPQIAVAIFQVLVCGA